MALLDLNVLLLISASLLVLTCSSDAELRPDFYDNSCPAALPTIEKAVRAAIDKKPRAAAFLLRIQFHDCFVQGCDASVMLDDSPSIVSEQNGFQNFQSLRGMEIIDEIKSAVEGVCPGIVSCADIIAVAARDASVYTNGPTWEVKVGRRDSTTASKELVTLNMPLSSDSLQLLISSFARQGLNEREMVALSGAHTLGAAQCKTFRLRIYNATKIDPSFARLRRRICPAVPGANDTTTAPLDATKNKFDTVYFKNLVQWKGLLKSDQVLFNGGSSDAIVREYSENMTAFFSDFSSAMVKMGDINTLTGTAGQVRRNCRVVN